MTTSVLAVAASLAVFALASPASANAGDSDKPVLRVGDDEADQDESVTWVVSQERPETREGVTTVSGAPSPEPEFTMSYRVLETDPNTGEECTGTRWIVGYAGDARGPAADSVRLAEEAYVDAVGDPPPPPCSGLIIDREQIVRRAADIVSDELDPAVPYLQPSNRAITGLRSFLATNVEVNRTETTTVTLFDREWDVEVRIEGVHSIDWGDGTVDTGITSDGGPWHEGPVAPGDIVHTYLDNDSYELVVTTTWTVTATLPATGESATQTLTTPSDPVTIDVDEVRSARDR